MLKRTGFKTKQRKPMKRSGFKTKSFDSLSKRKEIRQAKAIDSFNFMALRAWPSGGTFGNLKKPLRQTKLRKLGKSPTSKIKRDIQAVLRQITIGRDGGCILQNTLVHSVNKTTDKMTLQAEHLITRANNATYADSRLVVCICKGCHTWKHLSEENKETYDVIVKTRISKERIDLWIQREEEKNQICRKGEYEWGQDLINLKQELKQINDKNQL